MSDRPNHSDDDQLFKKMDAQEQIYAPQQIPGGVPVPEERDVQGSAGTGREQLNEDQVGFIPVRPDPGVNSPIPVPFLHDDRDDRNDNEGAHDTTQGRG
jgi:hypothetical protein